VGKVFGLSSFIGRKLDKHAKNQVGSMLVEVLVATTILLIVFAAVVQQMGTLATTRVRIETRDRAVSYANTLHQIMTANGCGFDVDTVEETLFLDADGNPISGNSDSFVGSDQVALKGPWNRIQGCAFRALERVRETGQSTGVHSYVDLNGVVFLSNNSNGSPSSETITKDSAEAFCKFYGDDDSQYSSKSCELGDQEFTHAMSTNDIGVQTNFEVTVNYWFELVGGSNGISDEGLNRKSTCTEIVSAQKLPDTLARKVTVTFPDGKGGTETISMTKRENVPVDSFQFASGTRVGVAIDSATQTSMYPKPGSSDPFKVTRTRAESNGCIWFPYIARHSAGQAQPTFSIDGTGAMEATLSDIPALGTGLL
jgi:type II secretory pathway pseudopilin PulG